MADSEVEDWLGVAVGAVIDLPASVLDKAALEARRTCTHHAQIVPAIVKAADAIMAREASLREASAPANVLAMPPEKRLPAPRLTQADCDTMHPILRRLGLSAGYLTENEDGTVSPTPDTAA